MSHSSLFILFNQQFQVKIILFLQVQDVTDGSVNLLYLAEL